MVTKEEITKLIEKGKRPTKEIILFYQNEIHQRIRYDILIDKIKNEFGYTISYASLVMGVKRHLKDATQKVRSLKATLVAEEKKTVRPEPIKNEKKQMAQKKDAKNWGFVDGPASSDDGTAVFDL